MSEMIERVAAAIDKIVGNDHESFSIEMGCGSLAKKWRAEAMQDCARAAIEAMRKPTGKMLKAPDSIMGGGFMNSHSDLETWEVMLDAALEDDA
jgi:hypothetical protein